MYKQHCIKQPIKNISIIWIRRLIQNYLFVYDSLPDLRLWLKIIFIWSAVAILFPFSSGSCEIMLRLIEYLCLELIFLLNFLWFRFFIFIYSPWMNARPFFSVCWKIFIVSNVPHSLFLIFLLVSSSTIFFLVS